MSDISALLACPRCDKTPLRPNDGRYRCSACRIDFPALESMPWLFAEPQAALGEWRGRMHFALQKIAADIASVDGELSKDELRELTQRRLVRYRTSLESHARKLHDLLQPLELEPLRGSVESYLALRTRLPVDQGLNTYYANIHRDWCWGDEENLASLKQIQSVLHNRPQLGNVLILGAGAGRLAYDIHTQLDTAQTIAMDFNPLLMLVARTVTTGRPLTLYEFPIAPLSLEDNAVPRELSAPAAVDERFHLVLGDALRPPFAPASFDTVVTPWLIDIIAEDLQPLAARINGLLRDNGRWINFGSLAFAGPAHAGHYSPEETRAIVVEAGFSDPYIAEATIPYMCSPASRHGRRETVFTFAASKKHDARPPERYRALPDWLITGREPVPLTAAFRQQAATTQIYSFIMSLIDGKRSIQDMAAVLEAQKLMTREEAEPAIRSFITKMYDDAGVDISHVNRP